MRGSRTVAWGALAASVALAVRALPSAADDARIALVWRTPPGCPDEASVRADVARLLAGSSATGSARADVTHAGDSWRVVVAMNGGERRLEAGSCRALAEATALIVALAVDPARVAANRASPATAAAGGGAATVSSEPIPLEAGASSVAPIVDAASPDVAVADAGALAVVAPVAPVTPPAPPTADAGAPPEAAPVAPAPPPPSPPPRAPVAAGTPASASETTFALSAAGVLDLGTLPALAVGASVAVAWTPSRFRLELAGGYFLPDSTPPAAVTSAPVTSAVERFTLITGALRGCYLPRLGAFDLGPCALAEVASARGQGISIANPSSGSSAWFAPGAGFFGAWRLAQAWALFGRADALIPTIRPDFQVDGTTLHRPGFVTGRLSLGAELRF